MSLRKALKAVLIFVLIIGGFVAMWYGAVWLIFGVKWGKLVGVGLLFGGFRAVIGAYDLMWDRPPQFSKTPWARPWEERQNP